MIVAGGALLAIWGLGISGVLFQIQRDGNAVLDVRLVLTALLVPFVFVMALSTWRRTRRSAEPARNGATVSPDCCGTGSDRHRGSAQRP